MERSISPTGHRSLVLLSLLLFLHAALCDEINFYDENGSFSMIRTIGYGGCYKFAPNWDRRATAIDIVEPKSCFNVWKNLDCTGDHLKLTKKEGSYELRNMNFDKAISSVSLCSWDDQGRPDPMRGLQHYNSRPIYQPEEVSRGGGLRITEKVERVHVVPDYRTPIRGEYRQTQEVRTFSSPNSAATTTTITDLSYSEIQDLAVSEHNRFRAQLGAKELKGNTQIQADAQSYAESMASSNKFEATTYGNRYASNIATSFRRSKSDAVKDAISRWYSKAKVSDYELEATEMGIGCAWSEIERSWVIVGFYSVPDFYYIQKFHDQTGGNIPSESSLMSESESEHSDSENSEPMAEMRKSKKKKNAATSAHTSFPFLIITCLTIVSIIKTLCR